MLIKRVSQYSNITRELEIPVTEKQLKDWISGTSIQRAMPNLSSSQREFILTGITSEEWDEMHPLDDSDIDETSEAFREEQMLLAQRDAINGQYEVGDIN